MVSFASFLLWRMFFPMSVNSNEAFMILPLVGCRSAALDLPGPLFILECAAQ